MTAFLELIPALSALSGVFVHLQIWRHGEWDSFSGYVLFYAFLIHSTFLIILKYSLGLVWLSVYSTALYLESLHLFGTFTSIVFYRICFHRLRRFPGPLGGKIWIWDIFARTLRSHHRQSIVIDELHARYGPVVRYAPDRLSINYTAAILLVHGTGSTSQSTKSVVYLNPVNGGSINADRDVASHHARRKIWERALSARVLPSYIPPITHHAFALVSSLHSTNACPTNVNKHIRLFTFDTMGFIGFGREGGFDGLSTGILHPAIAQLVDMMGIGVYMMLVPWLHVLAHYVPAMGIVYRPDELFRGFAKETLSEYCFAEGKRHFEDHEKDPVPEDSRTPSDQKHRFKDILNQIHPNPSLNDRQTLSDCVLLSIAGADTTTSSLVHIIYRLARHPHLQAVLYREVLAAQPPVIDATPSAEAQFASWVESAKLPYVDAFIREVLRLHPPAPTGLPRLTPADGQTIALSDGSEMHIPGNSNVSIPVYTLMRDPQNFVQPLNFIPQRFLPPSHPEARPDLVRDMRAYIPFLQGPYGCAGKQLAYLEMKIVAAILLSSFEICFPEATNIMEVDQKVEMEWRDFSTVKAAEVQVCFLARSLERIIGAKAEKW